MREEAERLRVILQAEEDLYRRMRDLLLTEREVMSKLDASELGEVVRRKEEMSDEGRLLEESRVEVAKRLAEQLDLALPRPRLSDLCAALGNAAVPLREAHNRLLVMVGVVRELLEANAGLARDSLGQVQGTLRMLGGLVRDETLYRPSAELAPARAGQLLRRSV